MSVTNSSRPSHPGAPAAAAQTVVTLDVEALGRAIADRTERLRAPVIGLDEASVLVGLRGGALRSWMNDHNIRPVAHGRYPRHKIDMALRGESRQGPDERCLRRVARKSLSRDRSGTAADVLGETGDGMQAAHQPEGARPLAEAVS